MERIERGKEVYATLRLRNYSSATVKRTGN